MSGKQADLRAKSCSMFIFVRESLESFFGFFQWFLRIWLSLATYGTMEGVKPQATNQRGVCKS